METQAIIARYRFSVKEDTRMSDLWNKMFGGYTPPGGDKKPPREEADEFCLTSVMVLILSEVVFCYFEPNLCFLCGFFLTAQMFV
jgi:hypothetical protein